jgi:hypothetical protein
MTRLTYATAGLLALYRAVAPLVSNMPNPHPWTGIAFWISAISLILAEMSPAHRTKHVWAFMGSLLVVSVYVYGLFVLPLARKLGYIHMTAHLVIAKPNSFDRCRIFVDRPIRVLLLVFAIFALRLSGRALRRSKDD